MKKYLDQLHAKEPHQKREFAAHAAAGVTVLVFLIWVSTLGARIVGSGTPTTATDPNATNLIAATAEAGNAFQNQLQSYDQSNAAQATVQNVDQGAPTDSGGLYAATTTNTTNTTDGATMIGSPDNPATTLNQ